MRNTWLFLQGPPSGFSRRLAREALKRGRRAIRVNFCAGDWLYGLGTPAVNYRGPPDRWEDFAAALIRREGVAALLCYGDRQPYHRMAIRAARRLGVPAYAYEFGYLRPDWITLERNGLSAHSHFPADPQSVLRLAAGLPEPDFQERYRHGFATEAFNEVLYNLASYFCPFPFPRYDADRVIHPFANYLGYIPRLIGAGRAGRRASRQVTRLIADRRPFFFVPLQMQSDYQLRANSHYAHQSAFIAEIIASFHRAAPADAQLLFKVHPLDNGLENWPRIVADLAGKAGIEGRAHAIDGGCLQTILAHARGTALVNSTVGLHALRLRRPLKAMGMAVFDMPGLTHQGPLDAFWREASPPDDRLCDAFLRLLAAATQVKGSFYDRTGQDAAIAAFIDRIESGRVNGHGAFVSPPPRLARARALGVPHAEWTGPACAAHPAESQSDAARCLIP